MPELNLSKLSHTVADRFRPFAEDVLQGRADTIDSIHIVGSAATTDYDPKHSDINSVVVLKKMDLRFVEHIAPLGKKHRKNVSAPLIMTPEYICRSLDVFPIEFLDFKLVHETVWGDDLFAGIEIQRSDLRQQCERELKVKLIGLRQGYISSLGDKKLLSERFAASITGYIPLFRGIISLLGKEPPPSKRSVLDMLAVVTSIDVSVFAKVLDVKHGDARLSKEELDTLFEKYYDATEKIGKLIDELEM